VRTDLLIEFHDEPVPIEVLQRRTKLPRRVLAQRVRRLVESGHLERTPKGFVITELGISERHGHPIEIPGLGHPPLPSTCRTDKTGRPYILRRVGWTALSKADDTPLQVQLECGHNAPEEAWKTNKNRLPDSMRCFVCGRMVRDSVGPPLNAVERWILLNHENLDKESRDGLKPTLTRLTRRELICVPTALVKLTVLGQLVVEILQTGKYEPDPSCEVQIDRTTNQLQEDHEETVHAQVVDYVAAFRLLAGYSDPQVRRAFTIVMRTPPEAKQIAHKKHLNRG